MHQLITAATTAQAQKLKKQLNSTDVILGDYRDMPAFMLKSGLMLQLPKPTSVSYAHEMLTICLDGDVDTIYVLGDDEYTLLKEAEQLLNEFGIALVKPLDSD